MPGRSQIDVWPLLRAKVGSQHVDSSHKHALQVLDERSAVMHHCNHCRAEQAKNNSLRALFFARLAGPKWSGSETMTEQG